MKARLLAFLVLLAVAGAGCRRGVEEEPHDLTWFTNHMGRLYDSVSLGMVRSNVYETIGKPSVVRMHTGPYSNWVTDRYIHGPDPWVKHYPNIWSGVALSYSNEVLVQKEHLIRKGQP
jgi:hypothetical protein